MLKFSKFLVKRKKLGFLIYMNVFVIIIELILIFVVSKWFI